MNKSKKAERPKKADLLAKEHDTLKSDVEDGSLWDRVLGKAEPRLKLQDEKLSNFGSSVSNSRAR